MSKTPSRVRLTAGRVESFACPAGKSQAFLWDTEAPALMLRATPKGRKTYAFEARLNGATIRVGIGTAADWSLDAARRRAAELKRLVDVGQDPREIERQQQAEREAQRQQERAQAVTVGDVWPTYIAQGRPKRKDAWKPRYVADMLKMVSPGGEPAKRGVKLEPGKPRPLTLPGHLYPLMALPLVEVTEDRLAAWFDTESLRGKHQATRALMMFRGFLRWCSTKTDYRGLVNREAGRAPAIIENLPPATRRTDKLLQEQIAGWWAAVSQLPNPVHSVYLRALVLTGARREELATLTWDNVDFRWRKLTIADKEAPTRTIPLGPYMAQMLAGLPRKGPFVFHSTGAKGHVSDLRNPMGRALAEAGIEHLTFHGLRRTFTQTARRIVPAGVPAQISGHRQSAVAEGYNILSLDELRPYVEMIEKRFLALAGVTFDSASEPGKLRVVA